MLKLHFLVYCAGIDNFNVHRGCSLDGDDDVSSSTSTIENLPTEETTPAIEHRPTEETGKKTTVKFSAS